MDLYTSLTRLKMSMHRGELPPMTPIAVDAEKALDPAFTIGMGALKEHDAKGLQCPVRGCGQYFHHLTRHLNSEHKGMGGADGLRVLLDIPPKVRLTSQRSKAQRGAAARATRPHRFIQRRNSGKGEVIGAMKRMSYSTVAARNLRNSCDAQVARRLADLEIKLGCTPTHEAVKQEYGVGFYNDLIRAYGSFRNAMTQHGLRSTPHRYTLGDVLEMLRTYYDVNGHLPSWEEAIMEKRTPALPSHGTVRRVIGAETWAGCMRAAAVELGLDESKAVPEWGKAIAG